MICKHQIALCKIHNCTTCDHYVYSAYVPPTPVYTNGVWNGYGGVTRDGKKYLTINAMISDAENRIKVLQALTGGV